MNNQTPHRNRAPAERSPADGMGDRHVRTSLFSILPGGRSAAAGFVAAKVHHRAPPWTTRHEVRADHRDANPPSDAQRDATGASSEISGIG